MTFIATLAMAYNTFLKRMVLRLLRLFPCVVLLSPLVRNFFIFSNTSDGGGWLNPLWWLIPLLGQIIQAFAYLLNKVDRSKKFTAEYLIVARK